MGSGQRPLALRHRTGKRTESERTSGRRYWHNFIPAGSTSDSWEDCVFISSPRTPIRGPTLNVKARTAGRYRADALGSAPFAPLRQVERAGDGPRIGVRGDPRFREGRRWVRPCNRFRSTTDGISLYITAIFSIVLVKTKGRAGMNAIRRRLGALLTLGSTMIASEAPGGICCGVEVGLYGVSDSYGDAYLVLLVILIALGLLGTAVWAVIWAAIGAMRLILHCAIGSFSRWRTVRGQGRSHDDDIVACGLQFRPIGLNRHHGQQPADDGGAGS